MKTIIFFLFFLLAAKNLPAQHCPFDGMHLIAIKVVDKQGRMISNPDIPFCLVEVDNAMADSCTSAAGLIKKHFLIRNKFISASNERFYRNGYNKQLNNRLTKAGVFANANMMVTLNQAENTCTLIGKSETVYTNYIYRQRKFVITYPINGKEMQQPLPDELIYALCTNAKEIEKFKPLIIKL